MKERERERERYLNDRDWKMWSLKATNLLEEKVVIIILQYFYNRYKKY